VLLLVAVGAITSTVRWLELLAVGLFVFDRTGSAFLVASMTLLRMLPLAIFGAYAGALAERTRRTPVLRVTMAALAVLAAVLAVLAARDALAVWLMAVAAFASGVFWAMDNAFRRTIISDMVPPARLARAIALDVLANNGSRMVGPLLGAVSLMLWLRERHYRRMYFFAVVLHQFAALVFAQSAWVGLCAAALLSAGLAGAAFSAMQSTLVMLCAEPAARTRMMGVLSVCIGTGPVGFLHLGWLAEHLGAPWAVTVLALEGLLALWLTARVWPELLARQPESA
jgi:MFS family permease